MPHDHPTSSAPATADGLHAVVAWVDRLDADRRRDLREAVRQRAGELLDADRAFSDVRDRDARARAAEAVALFHECARSHGLRPDELAALVAHPGRAGLAAACDLRLGDPAGRPARHAPGRDASGDGARRRLGPCRPGD